MKPQRSLPSHDEKKGIDQSFLDLREDFETAQDMLRASRVKLQKFKNALPKFSDHLLPPSHQCINENVGYWIKQCQRKEREGEKYKEETKSGKHSLRNLRHLSKKRDECYDLLRTQQGMLAALYASSDWQSPSFLHACRSQAGRQTGKIIGTLNDYKRDQHGDAKEYERQFLKEYIDGIVKLPIWLYLTNSGMAAFTTILTFLIMERKVKRRVLIGSSIYFENKELIKRLFRSMVIEVPDHDTDALLAAVKREKPSVICLDSLCNAPSIAVPDLETIIRKLNRSVSRDTYLVIDNTGRSVTFQPFPLVFAKTRKVHLLVWESLNKYYQFGMDRVTGGVMWGLGRDVSKLFDYRVHTGTNIADVSVLALPPPSRKILERRLKRHNRNATEVAKALYEHIHAHPTYPFEDIMYPGLSHHACYAWSKSMRFHGSYVNITFKKKHQRVKNYRKFIKLVIDQAREQKVDIVSGTSFGLNTTRVYLTAVRSKVSEPFIRISIGTEHLRQVYDVVNVLTAAMDQFARMV